MSHAHVPNMASMRGATRVRRTIQQVRTHFPVLHPSRSAYTHTPRSRDAARTTACSEPRQTSPSTMLIPTRTARSFECRGASSLSLRGYNDTRRGEAGRGEARRGGAGRAAVRCGAVRATTNEGSTKPTLTEDWPFIPVTQSPRICHVTQQFVAAFWAAPWPISGSLSWQPSVNILSRDSI